MDNDFNKHIKKLLKEHPEVFPTEAKFWAYLRGALRLALWNKSRIKLNFKSRTAGPPPEEYQGKGRKGHFCALTGVWVPVSKSEVDHRKGNIPLSQESDIIPFILHMLATEEDLAIVSKEAHRVKSYAERMGMSFEDALIEKKAIALCKGNLDKEFLISHNQVPASSKDKRRAQIITYLKEHNE